MALFLIIGNILESSLARSAPGSPRYRACGRTGAALERTSGDYSGLAALERTSDYSGLVRAEDWCARVEDRCVRVRACAGLVRVARVWRTGVCVCACGARGGLAHVEDRCVLRARVEERGCTWWPPQPFRHLCERARARVRVAVGHARGRTVRAQQQKLNRCKIYFIFLTLSALCPLHNDSRYFAVVIYYIYYYFLIRNVVYLDVINPVHEQATQ